MASYSGQGSNQNYWFGYGYFYTRLDLIKLERKLYIQSNTTPSIFLFFFVTILITNRIGSL